LTIRKRNEGNKMLPTLAKADLSRRW